MWQPVLMINGFLIAIIGLSMLVPAAYDVAFSNLKWSPFLTAALIAVFSGLALFLGNRMKINKITLKQGFLITVVGWVSVCCFATIPFMLYGACDSLADAFFETISGLTTTGGTIFADVEKLPKSILLWRSILNAVGGFGIVIFAVAMLPFLGIGGMQIFQRENSDVNEKFMPKFSYIAKRIVIAQVILIFVCFLCLCWAGMGKFDALNHAMATISTGGLSTKNASVGYFNSVSIEMIIMLFMILGSLPMTFYIVLWQRKDWKEFGTSQIWAFLKILVIYILATSVYLTYIGVYDWWRAVRFASFNIVFNHDPGCFPAYNVLSREIDIQTLPPFFYSCFKSVFVVADTCVVYYDIKMVPFFHNLTDAGSHLVFFCDIGNDIESFLTFFFDNLNCFSRSGPRKNRDVRSGPGQFTADDLPDAAACSCHKSHFTFKRKHIL